MKKSENQAKISIEKIFGFIDCREAAENLLVRHHAIPETSPERIGSETIAQAASTWYPGSRPAFPSDIGEWPTISRPKVTPLRPEKALPIPFQLFPIP